MAGLSSLCSLAAATPLASSQVDEDAARLKFPSLPRPLLMVLVAAFAWLVQRPGHVAQAKASGLATIAYGANTGSDFKRAFALGYGGVMTDRPAALAAFVAARRKQASE